MDFYRKVYAEDPRPCDGIQDEFFVILFRMLTNGSEFRYSEKAASYTIELLDDWRCTHVSEDNAVDITDEMADDDYADTDSDDTDASLSLNEGGLKMPVNDSYSVPADSPAMIPTIGFIHSLDINTDDISEMIEEEPDVYNVDMATTGIEDTLIISRGTMLKIPIYHDGSLSDITPETVGNTTCAAHEQNGLWDWLAQFPPQEKFYTDEPEKFLVNNNIKGSDIRIIIVDEGDDVELRFLMGVYKVGDTIANFTEEEDDDVLFQIQYMVLANIFGTSLSFMTKIEEAEGIDVTNEENYEYMGGEDSMGMNGTSDLFNVLQDVANEEIYVVQDQSSEYDDDEEDEEISTVAHDFYRHPLDSPNPPNSLDFEMQVMTKKKEI